MTTNAFGFINFAAEPKADSKSETSSRTDETFAALGVWPMLQLVLSTAAGLLISAGVANAFSWDLTKEQQAQQLVKQFQVLHQVPSVSISVTVNNNPVLARSFGIDGSIVQAGEKVRYHIGSVSKQFTAAAVLALIEDRTIVPSTNLPITLDTLLRELFPNLDRTSDVGMVTVRRLLTMTSNLPSYTNDALAFSINSAGVVPASQPIEANAIIQRLKSYNFVGPALTFGYSNTNYFILALIIDALKGDYKLTNPPAAQKYVHHRLLAKAGMTLSGFVGEPPPPGAIDARPTFLRSPLLDQGAWPKGAGDLVSTADDMARWNIALMSGRIISAPSLETLLTPVAPGTDSPGTDSKPYHGCLYAMGWYVCERPGYRLHQHDGVISGFMASNAIGRQKDGSWMSVTVLANSDATIDIVALARGIVEVGH